MDPRAVDEPHAIPQITSRVAMTEGRITDCNTHGPWDFQKADQYLAWKAGWTIRCTERESLHFPFGGNGGTTLYPVAGRIDLHIKSVPKEQQGPGDPLLAPVDDAHDPFEDFLVYNDLVPPGLDGPLVPTWPRSGLCTAEGSFVTCGLGSASV